VPTYNTSISRDASNDPLVPTPVAAQIIQDLPASSAVLARARRVAMSASTNRLPVLSVLPTAYFVSGDTGLKQTSSQDWENVTLTAEEIAVIVPIPQAYLDDAQVPIWDEVRPRIVEAVAKVVDAAALFGTNKPSTWSTDIATAATAAGNTVNATSYTDIAQAVSHLARVMAEQGESIDGFASEPGFPWRLSAMRSTDGLPIYQPNLQGAPGGSLFGYPFTEVRNGGWDANTASVIAGDWSKAIVGLRQDISFQVFDQGVISDGSGNVVLNLMQQDAVALRAVMRLGFATANPVTALQGTSTARYPFGLLAPVTGS